ncbi:MAG: ribosome maturation factor RimM [Candidatus Dormibacteria bacterium]
MQAPASIRVGFIRRAVGLSGEVEVEPLGDNPGRFSPGSALLVASRTVRVERVSPTGGLLRVRFHGIDDRDAADSIRGKYLEVDSSDLPDLPDGAYYEWQLVGLEVVDGSGAPLGRLEEVLEYPANDVYRVAGATDELLVPAVREVVRSVDLESGRMVVDLPPVDEVR